ncbi:MAG: T9SS type A sorting domain-containing protein [Lewinellaceae bacterium]|nr:T9SS type A sorting domain-containing protein [Lewinellaceae bacterium]
MRAVVALLIAFCSITMTLASDVITLTGYVDDANMYLQWNMDADPNIEAIYVEQKVGQTFESIAILAPQTNRQYSFDQPTIAQSVKLYRVRAVRVDGQQMLSNELNLETPRVPFEIKVYPNPVVSEVYANLPDACQHARDIQIRINDMYGRAVASQNVAPKTVSFEITPVEQLQAGMYVIQFWVDGKLEKSTSILKQ